MMIIEGTESEQKLKIRINALTMENVSQKETIKELTETITKLKNHAGETACMLHAASTEIEFHRSIIETLQQCIDEIVN